MWSEKAQIQEVGGDAAEDQRTNPNFQLVNKASQISPHKVLQLWLINTVYHYFISKEYLGEGKDSSIERGTY